MLNRFRNNRKLVLTATLMMLCTGCRDPSMGWGLRPAAPIAPIQGRMERYDGAPIPIGHIPVLIEATPDPRIPIDPEKAVHWNLSVHNAIAIALENSEVVRTSALVQTFSANDAITARATVYDQMISATQRQAALGIFDTSFSASMFWNKTDLPPGTSFNGIGARPPQSDGANFNASLSQLLKTGGTVSMGLNTNYFFVPPPLPGPNPNPQYFSNLEFAISQPLLQGAGVQVTMAPIAIAATRAEQDIWQFKLETLALVRSVESAYWGLYAAQKDLQAIEKVIPMFDEVVRIEKRRAEADTVPESEVARARVDSLGFRQQRLAALSRIAEQHIVLRNLLGISPSDGRYLDLTDTPTGAPVDINWGQSVATAMDRRPDVLRQRLAIHIADLESILANDAYRPNLDFEALWRTNGLGSDLSQSYNQMNGNDFNDWQIGANFEMPLGRRAARANMRGAELNISRQKALLHQVSHQATFELADSLRRLEWLSKQYQVARDRVEAAEAWQAGAKARYEKPAGELGLALALELYLRNLRTYAEAAQSSNDLLAKYNIAMARFEEVQGTLLDSFNLNVMNDHSDAVLEKLGPGIPVPEELEPMNPDDPNLNSPTTDRSTKIQSPVAVKLRDYRIPRLRVVLEDDGSSYQLPSDNLPAVAGPVVPPALEGTTKTSTLANSILPPHWQPSWQVDLDSVTTAPKETTPTPSGGRGSVRAAPQTSVLAKATETETKKKPSIAVEVKRPSVTIQAPVAVVQPIAQPKSLAVTPPVTKPIVNNPPATKPAMVAPRMPIRFVVRPTKPARTPMRPTLSAPVEIPQHGRIVKIEAHPTHAPTAQRPSTKVSLRPLGTPAKFVPTSPKRTVVPPTAVVTQLQIRVPSSQPIEATSAVPTDKAEQHNGLELRDLAPTNRRPVIHVAAPIRPGFTIRESKSEAVQVSTHPPAARATDVRPPSVKSARQQLQFVRTADRGAATIAR